MSPVRFLLQYFATLPTGRTVLWCYLIWYLITVLHHFDPSPALWLNSLGISAVIGVALLLSVSGSGRPDGWQIFRLFLMPFCVSSFSSLIKGHGFILIVSPDRSEQLAAFGSCGAFILLTTVLRRSAPSLPGPLPHGAPAAPDRLPES